MKQLFEFSPVPVGPVPAGPKPSLFGHPDDVLNSPDMTSAEKRAILASWISDARAVANAPSLRRLDSGAVVDIDLILQALKSLDADEGAAGHLPRKSHRVPAKRRKSGPVRDWLRRAVRPDHFDDDDHPPSAPASAAIPLRLRPPKVETVQMLRGGGLLQNAS